MSKGQLKNKIILSLLFVFSIISCNNKEKVFHESKDFSELVKDVKKNKLRDRIQIWDSLIQNAHLDKHNLAIIYYNKAIDLNIYSNHHAAIELYDKAMQVFKKEGDELMQANTYINLGISYSMLGKKSMAIDNVLKGFELAKKLNDNNTISRAYAELAHIYYLFNDKDKSIEYLNKTLDLEKKAEDTTSIAATYINMSVVYTEQEKYEKAMEYALRAIKINQLTNNDVSLIYGYGNLAKISWKLDRDLRKTMEYNRKALQIIKENNINLPEIYDNIAEVYMEINRLDSAEYYINKALDCKIENISDKIKYYNKLLKVKLKKGQIDKALDLIHTKDSLISVKEQENQSEAKRSIENSMLYISNQKQLEQAKQLNKKNRIIFIFIIVVFLLGILISYQLNRFDKLKYKQEHYVLEQKILRSQMNPHFIFNVLSSIQSTLIENNPLKSATYLSKFAQLIRQNFDFVQKSKIPLRDELSMIENYIETQKFRYKDKFEYEIIVDESIDQLRTNIPPMILQPFVENAIEHGFKNIDYKGLLKIHITDKNNKVCFEITDNGKGFKGYNQDSKEHALDIFKRRLEILGKEEIDSFKIILLEKGTKFVFCLTKK